MRFRFSIRDLLWLTALAALAVSWWLDHRAQVDRYQSLLPQQKVYPIAVADPNAVLRVLQSSLAGLPDVRLSVDIASSSVVAVAHQSQQEVIRKIIDKLEGASTASELNSPQNSIRIFRPSWYESDEERLRTVERIKELWRRQRDGT